MRLKLRREDYVYATAVVVVLWGICATLASAAWLLVLQDSTTWGMAVSLAMSLALLVMMLSWAQFAKSCRQDGSLSPYDWACVSVIALLIGTSTMPIFTFLARIGLESIL